MMNNSALAFWIVIAALVAGGYGAFKWRQVQQAQQRGGVSNSEISLPPLEEFELTERSGKPFRSADMKGKVWVVTFFFSTCPGSCARLNANIKNLSSEEAFRDVTFVSVTVDPDTDTLPVLRKYADSFNADPERWLFCRGDFEYVKRLSQEVLRVGGVSYKGHNDYAVIVDKAGEIAGMFNASSTRESLAAAKIIEKCLAEPWPPAEAKPSPSDDAAMSDEQPAEAA
jgi:cytochrome oxidase Cu insertion factor (SCO1/SenC/PrrC family)